LLIDEPAPPATTSPFSNLVGGTLTRYILLGLNIGVGLWLMPFTVAHLGTAQYGLWMLVASVTSYFSLLDLGYDSGLVRYIAAADARRDVTGVNRVVSTFVFVYAIIAAIAGVATAMLLIVAVPRFPKLTSEDVATARVVLAILGARVAIGFPMTVFGAVASARRAFVLNNCVAIVLVIVNAVVTYLVLASGGQLIALVASTTAVSMAGYLAYAATARRVFPQLRIDRRLVSRELWRDVTKFSAYLFVVDIASQLTFNLDNVLVGAYLGVSAVAVYAVAVRLSDYQRRLCDQFSGMLFSVAVGLEADGTPDRLRAALVEGSRVATTLVIGVTIAILGFAQPLVRHWMGPAFDGSVAPLIVLAFVGVVLVTSASAHSILLATGSQRLVAIVWISEGVANLALSLLLVGPFGSVGVAIGTAIPICLGHFGLLIPAACRRVGIAVPVFAVRVLKPALIGAPPAVAFCVVARLAGDQASTWAVVGAAALAGLIYLSFVLAFGLNAADRRRYAAPLVKVFT
jgi:O-antigen/teichoic acid export membrane protein